MCINSFFGIPLQKAVLGFGFFHLAISLILAIISVVGLSQCEESPGIDCVGPRIRQVRQLLKKI